MSATQDAVRDEVRKGSQGKSQRVYGPSAGNLVIWYHDANKPSELWFGKVVTAMTLARTIMTSAVTKLEAPPTQLTKKIMKRFFKLDDDKKSEPFFEGIVSNYQKMKLGLSQQMVLCLSQKKLDEDTRGYHGKHIHLNSTLVDCHDMSVARTIIHESAHAFAGMYGTRTHGWTTDEELYVHSSAWEDAHPNDRRGSADAYAWAAISLHQGRVLFPNDGFNDYEGPN